MPEFVHLHVHSHYSLLDGLSKIDDMVKLAKERGMTAIGLTDHGTMYGIIDFYSTCIKNGIKPIIGVETYVANRTLLQKEAGIDNRRYHLTLLAKDNTGYKNLIKLVTIAHLEGYYYKPRVDKELLRNHAEGIIALSGCIGSELGRTIQSGNKEKAIEVIREYQSIFGKENYYLEIMHHPDVEGFWAWRSMLIELSKELNIPLVATQDSHYLHEEDALAHKTLVAISTNTDVGDTGIFSGEGHYHFISAEEAMEWFKDIPEAVTNTQKIAERCNIELTLGKFIFPDFALEPGKTADQMLDELTKQGAMDRGLNNDQEIEKRRLYELDVIKQKHYSPYFLVVADLLRFARESHIYTTVRGSAAGSLVGYLAGITNVNPIEFQLPFERFLNPFRPSAPDIDMDFADDRRQEVIEYAKRKYGAEKVAQIGTFGTMMARGAVRDVTRVFGKPYELGDRIAKLIPMGSQGFPMTIDHALEIEPELKKLYDSDNDVKQILDIAKKLEGTVRHVSVHAAGVVIAPKPLVEYVPVQLDPKEGDKLITQYDMYTVGEDGVGLTKLDFLGIRNLAILEDAVRLVKEHRNIIIDIEKIPFDDKVTFSLLSKGETEGLFQLNGEGMTKHLIDLKPTTIHDINAMVALYRPGPMNNIPEYIARKQGRSPIKYFHPKAESFLAKSYGILVYQDDLLFTALELAGYNWETVDKFRKAVGKKIPAEMAKQHVIFVQGCQEHSGMTKDQAEQIWNLFEPFQGYGFNKAHAACYGRVAYQTAYMKANFPAEYMCAVLSAESGDTEKVAEIITECKRMEIPVLPPDINSSFKNFTVMKASQTIKTDEIRFGLHTVKNVGENVIGIIIEERKKNGPFKDVYDFFSRVHSKDINKKSIESLAQAGAFDSLVERNVVLENIETLLNFNRDITKQALSNQANLFGGVSADMIKPTLNLKEVEPATMKQRLSWEKELLGLFVSGHPLAGVSPSLAAATVPIADVTTDLANEQVKVGGIITKVQRIITRNQKAMAFVTMEDRSGSLEILIFTKLLETTNNLWIEDKIVVIEGRISDKDGVAKILADKAEEFDPEKPPKPLEDRSLFENRPPVSITISVPAKANKRTFLDLKSVLEGVNKGRTAVFLEIQRENERKDTVKTSYSVVFSPFLESRVSAVLGQKCITVQEAKTTIKDKFAVAEAENV
jgi:DNA polymerase-3 subunit alpha